jgi:hypothetical protein
MECGESFYHMALADIWFTSRFIHLSDMISFISQASMQAPLGCSSPGSAKLVDC